MPKFCFFLLLLPVLCLAQHQLTVTVTGVENTEGNINIALYTTDDGFLKSDQHYTGIVVKSEKGTTTGLFSALPKGKYAIALFHDENANAELDTNFLGIPKEPLGFSIGKLKTFGPPNFEECSFVVDYDMAISVPLSD